MQTESTREALKESLKIILKEAEEKKKEAEVANPLVRCPSCKIMETKEHIDILNGEGTYEKEKSKQKKELEAVETQDE